MPFPDRFTHDPANPAHGENVSCSFYNPALANQTIDIVVLSDNQPFQTKVVTLDANGFGQFSFTAVASVGHTLQQETSSDHGIITA